MSDLESRLREAVRARTEAYAPPSDLPDRIEAAVAKRRRRDQRARVAAAAGALAAAVLVATFVLRTGSDSDQVETGDDGRPDPTTTTEPAPTTTETTAPTTTGSTVRVSQPVTAEEVAALAYPFSGGVGSFPEPCRSYWEANDPGEQGFGGGDNGIEIAGGDIATADLDGDGVDDGLATFTCTTAGTIPPDGVLALLADGRIVATNVGSELRAANQEQRGDERTDLRGAPSVPAVGQVAVARGSYAPEDPNAGASGSGTASFELDGDVLHLVDLALEVDRPDDGAPSPSGEAVSAATPLSRSGVGPVRAGMTVAEVNAATGMTTTVHEPIGPDSTCVTGDLGGLDLLLSREGVAGADPDEARVTVVYGESTVEGVAIGAPVADMDAAYGPPTRTNDYPYVEGGEVRVYASGEFAYAAVTDGTSITGLRSGNASLVNALEGCA